MNSTSKIINIEEILSICEAECEGNEGKFDEKEFEDFLKFLEVDFYDWVRGNLSQYSIKEIQQ